MVLKFNDFNSVNENFTIIKDRLNMGTTIRFDIFDQGEKVGTINMSTDEYDYLDEDTGDYYTEKNIAACLIRVTKNSSNTQYLLDQN